MKGLKIGVLYHDKGLGQALARRLSLPYVAWTLRALIKACSEVKTTAGEFAYFTPMPMMEIFSKEPESGVVSCPSFLFPYIWISKYGFPDAHRRRDLYFAQHWAKVVNSYDWIVSVLPPEGEGAVPFPVEMPSLMAHAAIHHACPEKLLVVKVKGGKGKELAAKNIRIDDCCTKLVEEIVARS